MQHDQIWFDIGPQKTTLLKSHGFDVFGEEFVRRGNNDTRTLAFKHARDTSLAALRAELTDLPS
jgi:hypothetical protein